MVASLTAAVWQRIVSDSEVTEAISTYEGFPAVFTDDRVPGDAVLPYIVSSGNPSDEPWDSKTSQGRRVTRDIVVHTEHQDTATVEAVAEKVRDLFHRHLLQVDGYRTVVARASIARMSSDDYDGRVVTVRFTLSKENA